MRQIILLAVVLSASFSVSPESRGEETATNGDWQIAALVVDEEGSPVADAHVGGLTFDQRLFETSTDEEGKAVLSGPQDAPLETVWAAKAGVGVDYDVLLADEHEEPDAATSPEEFEQPIKFVLIGVRDVAMKVIDDQTREPIADALVIPWYLYKAGKAAEFNTSGLAEFSRRTDERGVASFDILPVDNAIPIPFLIRAPHHVAHEVPILAAGATPAEITAEMVRMVRVTGRVVGADGSPVAGATVLAAGDGYHFGYFRTAAETNDDGTFEMEVSPEEYYSLMAERGEAVSPATNVVVRKGQPVAGIEIKLEPGTRLFGRVTVAPDEQPVADYELKLRQQPSQEYVNLPAEEQLPNPAESRDYIQPLLERTTRTDESGHFEFFVGPGRYYLVGPFSAPVHRFTVRDEDSLEVNLAARDRTEFADSDNGVGAATPRDTAAE